MVTAATATADEADTQAQRPAGAPPAGAAATAAPASSGFDFGGIISMIVNFLKSILTGAGSMFSSLIGGGSTATPTTTPSTAEPAAPAIAPQTSPAQLATAQAQAQAAVAANTSPAVPASGNPNTLPRQADAARQSRGVS